MGDNNGTLLSSQDRDDILRMYTDMKGKYTAFDAALAAGKPVGEIKGAIDKITGHILEMQTKYEEIGKRADQIEAQANERKAQLERPKTFGECVVDAPGFLDAMKARSQTGFSMTIKASAELRRSLSGMGYKDITGLSTALPQILPGIALGARLPLGVRSLIPGGNTTAGAISYLKETAFTNNAAPVAEAAAKPKSDKTLAPTTAVATTIAHYFKVSRQAYEDVPGLSALIENNGIYGVQSAEDNQLLNGNGVAPQLDGLMKNATAAPAVPPVSSGGTLMDAVGLAVFDLASKGYMPDGTVVNPADYGAMAMLKNSQGNYLFSNPIDYNGIPRMWGTRLVMSSKMTAGNFLVGAFQGNSLLLDREEVNVQIASQNEDDFIKNMLTILIEERIIFMIFVAAAFEKGVKPTPTMAEA